MVVILSSTVFFRISFGNICTWVGLSCYSIYFFKDSVDSFLKDEKQIWNVIFIGHNDNVVMCRLPPGLCGVVRSL